MYSKGGMWLKYFGHSNFLCTRTTRTIFNHASIGEYRLRFFCQENISCLCNDYPIETRWHILHECRRFNKYWNPRRDSISHFILFWNLTVGLFHLKGLLHSHHSHHSIFYCILSFHFIFLILFFYFHVYFIFFISFPLSCRSVVLYIVMT